MYVESMTLEEIRREIIKDSDYINIKIESILSDNKYRKACLKMNTTNLHYFKRVDFTNKKSGFEYHMIPSTFGKRDYLKNGMKILVFVTFRWHKRTWVCIPLHNSDNLLFVAPHFFDRYMERAEKIAEDRLSLITYFLSKNRILSDADYVHQDHENSLFWTMDDGIGFGTKHKDYKVMSTYVRKDMVFENQESYLLEGEMRIEEVRLSDKYE